MLDRIDNRLKRVDGCCHPRRDFWRNSDKLSTLVNLCHNPITASTEDVLMVPNGAFLQHTNPRALLLDHRALLHPDQKDEIEVQMTFVLFVREELYRS